MSILNSTQLPPALVQLPATLPLDGAVRLELQQGAPVFRASAKVQKRIDLLLQKQQNDSLTPKEQAELAAYEEIDDYLSFVNRLVRNDRQEEHELIQPGAVYPSWSPYDAFDAAATLLKVLDEAKASEQC